MLFECNVLPIESRIPDSSQSIALNRGGRVRRQAQWRAHLPHPAPHATVPELKRRALAESINPTPQGATRTAMMRPSDLAEVDQYLSSSNVGLSYKRVEQIDGVLKAAVR